VKRSNLAFFEEIAAHLSGARNDAQIKQRFGYRWIWVRIESASNKMPHLSSLTAT